MNQERDVKLIILEVLGCLDEKDKRNLKFLKENDEAFCWKDLAEYQNLSALLSSTLKLETPSSRSKEILAKYLNRINFGKEDVSQTEKYVFDDITVEELNLEDASIQNNVNRGSISESNFKSPQISGFKEVKSRTTSIKEKANQIYKQEYLKNEKQVQIKKEQYFEEEFENVEEEDLIETSEVISENYKQSPSSLKKYIVTSIILFVVIVSLAGYIFFFKNSDVNQLVTDNKQADTPSPVLEEFQYDSLKDTKLIMDTIEIPEMLVVDNPSVEKKQEEEKNVLPQAPPKLPEPIDAPLITVEDALEEQKPKIEEVISSPPPKEIIEETEEPTFFVAVEEMPKPIGGLSGIQEKIKYPEIALRAGIEGKVYVKAYVDEAGNVVDAEVVKGIGAGCDEAALEAIMKTKFTPGMQRGKAIKVQITVPVQFKL